MCRDTCTWQFILGNFLRQFWHHFRWCSGLRKLLNHQVLSLEISSLHENTHQTLTRAGAERNLPGGQTQRRLICRKNFGSCSCFWCVSVFVFLLSSHCYIDYHGFSIFHLITLLWTLFNVSLLLPHHIIATDLSNAPTHHRSPLHCGGQVLCRQVFNLKMLLKKRQRVKESECVRTTEDWSCQQLYLVIM